MKLIKPSVEIIPQGQGLVGMERAIEMAGRTCYKSVGTRYFEIQAYVKEGMPRVFTDEELKTILNDKRLIVTMSEIGVIWHISIPNEFVKDYPKLLKYEVLPNQDLIDRYWFYENLTAHRFVERMLKSGHGAMLEFGTVYLKIPLTTAYSGDVNQYIDNKYTKVNYTGVNCETDKLGNTCCVHYVTTNFRVIMQGDYQTWDEAQKNNYDKNWLDDIKEFGCEPTEYHEKRVWTKFITDRGISHELVRHRVFSFAQESTRYCNYSKAKFGEELTYICPSWLDYEEMNRLAKEANIDNKILYTRGHDESLSMEERAKNSFIFDMSNYEHGYLFQIACGWKAEEARSVLPNSIKTEINMCGFISDWKHFFLLRDNPKAHPDMQILAKDLHDKFITKGLL